MPSSRRDTGSMSLWSILCCCLHSPEWSDPSILFQSHLTPSPSLLIILQPHWVWWLISCIINLTGPQGAQAFGQTLFWVYLWGCSWMRLISDSPGFPACQLHILGLLSFHKYMSQFLIKYNIYTDICVCVYPRMYVCMCVYPSYWFVSLENPYQYTGFLIKLFPASGPSYMLFPLPGTSFLPIFPWLIFVIQVSA